LTAAKRAGSLPGSLERLIDELLEPVIPWKEVLARFIDSNAANDYTWTLPNRRYLPQGIYLPSLKSPELGHIGIFDDTSGSHFSAEQQRKALSEIQGILTSYQNVKATLIFVDTKVQGEPIELEADLEINIPKPQGGGGTSFRPPFEYAEEHALEIKAAIYITDGECSNFPEPPDYETLWLLTEANRNFNPPFGEVITMEKED
jgi:predicted metal-dependent peptidase